MEHPGAVIFHVLLLENVGASTLPAGVEIDELAASWNAGAICTHGIEHFWVGPVDGTIVHSGHRSHNCGCFKCKLFLELLPG